MIYIYLMLKDNLTIEKNTIMPNKKHLSHNILMILLALIGVCAFPVKGRTQNNYDQYILTPPPPAKPRITGPKIYGARPNAPFIYRIPCTGKRPIVFSEAHLPKGLTLDKNSGIITGRIAQKGEYICLLKARNKYGSTKKSFKIVIGDKLALTPPMGWNSWYIHYNRVSDKVMREAADQMIASGMADYGYQYVNIDDCWAVKVDSDDPVTGGPTRNKNGNILPNKRFPNMSKLTAYIHSKGLKAGIYTSPGPQTCAGYEGSYDHESQDARTFAHWGFDFLKYDWCSYGKYAGGKTRKDYIRPYQLMWNELQKQKRDIVFNLCQYGMDSVWKWGAKVGNCWRTTGDLGLAKGDDLPGFYYIGFSNAQHWQYAGPGDWNDPDYILIGWVGDAHQMGKGAYTNLSPYEQYSYMSMWCLMAAPLIFSGDMTKLDKFTLNVLCNNEVIAVDQDPLGKQAKIIKKTDKVFILAKPMEDGSIAVGLFNLQKERSEITVTWQELGISGKQRVRDLWRQKELGNINLQFRSNIPPHGVALIRLWKNREKN